MPLPGFPRQPEQASPLAGDWFAGAAGRAILDSEDDVVRLAAAERPGQPWLRLMPVGGLAAVGERELPLFVAGGYFHGPMRCALPLPLASESVGTVVLQHVADGSVVPEAILEESARVLVPGGRLWLLTLNPLAPYRARWLRQGPSASEPVRWRRRLRNAGLEPEAVSQGVGPRWKPIPNASLQQGAGLRAAFLLRAEKRVVPLTPIRSRPAISFQPGVPAA
ncbi:methyltransferase domain-containing protein [Lysobacter sp. A6]|uniref:Methyltransferase domain-containing protein n=1 Tax=Noviluteimonas lactosilytica TaxID=2888523 RepID=A0ABS8JEU6_9GAMM|nr:methyltransferase domain-containing protein [Lysobacter lactosilyticus]MCC8362072.1 methyltransferase domain-containing protein [Lysobacter lactosilyticus]